MADCTYANTAGAVVKVQPSKEPATYVEQVASLELLNHLKLDTATKRPIWTKAIIDELDKLKAEGRTISCAHYPHSAEDLVVALELVHPILDARSSNSRDVVVGVVSAISPWVEYILWQTARFNRVVSVDYNPPIVCGVPWIKSKNVTTFASEVESYDLLMSFSGIEHSGLGRYGDPINDVGDIEAMEQMHRVLRPGGVLLLAVPTATATYTAGIYHRMYGADRLAWLLEGRFSFKARVWDGKTLGGWADVNKDPKLFPGNREIKGISDWMNQHVLVLQKQLPPENVKHLTKNECDVGPLKFSPSLAFLLLPLIYGTILIIVATRRARRVPYLK